MKGLRIRTILNNSNNLLAPPILMGGADFACLPRYFNNFTKYADI